ncbi:MAG: rhombosortase [Gammaproteobacteria bacterium]|nr:rhombosortase [Gammaproteobacteria bacterium]
MDSARYKVLVAAVFVYCLWVIQGYSELLEFDREQVLSGEIWRIWTAHLVHTNSSHFTLNLAAAIIIYFSFFTRIKLDELLMYGFVFSGLISVTLLGFYPSLDWYNGLSGLLHALVAYFSVRLARAEDKLLWAGLVIVWLKVLIEAIRAHSGHETLVGAMTVITDAHLIGAFFGTVTAFICMAHWRMTSNRCARHR